MKRIVFILFVIVFVVGGMFLKNYFYGPTNLNSLVRTTPSSPNSPSPSGDFVAYKVEEVAQNLVVPWSILFTSPTRMLVTERPGRIRLLENGALVQKPLLTFSEVSSKSEEGLMGLAIDPDYETNKFLYTSIAYSKNSKLVVKIVRLIDEGTSIRIDKTIIDNIPAAVNHAGNRLKFGPDGKLYSTTGDATDRNLGQDKKSLAGKILRMNPDGSIPSDNPFPLSYIYSWGHRNAQGIDWHPITKEMYSSEHGPSGFDGPGGGDEVNHILAGENYGWPIVSHENKKPGFIDPLVVYTPTVAPASLMIYSGKIFPQFKYNIFFGGLRGTGIYRIVLGNFDPNQVLENEKMNDINVGRVREVVEGPDGYIYFSSSNMDGRGNPSDGDDKIYRLIPQ